MLIMPSVTWLGVFWLFPLITALAMSFKSFDPQLLIGTEFTLDNYPRILSDPFFLKAFGRSLGIAAVTTLVSLLLGYPAAYHISTMNSPRLRSILTLIIFVPVMLSLVVTAFAWILILGPSGLLNQVIMGLNLSSEPVRFMNSETGVIIVLIYSFGPYMVLNIFAALENIDPGLVRAALIHGAKPWRAFRKVTLPMSMPGILSGSLLVFSLSVAAFVTPYIIGGNRVKVVPLLVYNNAVATFNWSDAATLSALLLIIMLLITFLATRLVERSFMSWIVKS